MSKVEIVIGVLVGLAVNEWCDVSPWLARKLVCRAATWWSDDPEIAAGYAEEWNALINQCPGKIAKLMVGAWFAAGAIRQRGVTRVRRNQIRLYGTVARIALITVFIFSREPRHRAVALSAQKAMKGRPMSLSHLQAIIILLLPVKRSRR